jgi:transcriptional regulator with XRE-family HTH domain
MSRRPAGDIDRTIGRRVRRARVTAKLTLEELAGAIGVAYQMVQKYERGGSRLASSTLVLIARATKRPIAFFFEGLVELAPAAAESPLAGVAQPPVHRGPPGDAGGNPAPRSTLPATPTAEA